MSKSEVHETGISRYRSGAAPVRIGNGLPTQLEPPPRRRELEEIAFSMREGDVTVVPIEDDARSALG
jgi:hypothetical protein